MPKAPSHGVPWHRSITDALLLLEELEVKAKRGEGPLHLPSTLAPQEGVCGITPAPEERVRVLAVGQGWHGASPEPCTWQGVVCRGCVSGAAWPPGCFRSARIDEGGWMSARCRSRAFSKVRGKPECHSCQPLGCSSSTEAGESSGHWRHSVFLRIF